QHCVSRWLRVIGRRLVNYRRCHAVRPDIMHRLKQALRRALPTWALNRYRQLRYGETWFDFEDRSLKEVFTHIYRQNIWGRGDGGLYSGPGSDPAVTAPYVAA